MTPAQLRTFKQALLDLREELLGRGAARIEPNRTDTTKVGGDEDEQPLTEMSQALASSRNRARAAELKQVDEAIARLERDPDIFGLCETCEEPIAPRRLSVCEPRSRKGAASAWRPSSTSCPSSRGSTGSAG